MSNRWRLRFSSPLPLSGLIGVSDLDRVQHFYGDQLGVPLTDERPFALVARGVTFTRYQGMDQDRRGAWTTPGGGRVAWFLDPDVNNLSLTELAGPG